MCFHHTVMLWFVSFSVVIGGERFINPFHREFYKSKQQEEEQLKRESSSYSDDKNEGPGIRLLI